MRDVGMWQRVLRQLGVRGQDPSARQPRLSELVSVICDLAGPPCALFEIDEVTTAMAATGDAAGPVVPADEFWVIYAFAGRGNTGTLTGGRPSVQYRSVAPQLFLPGESGSVNVVWTNGFAFPAPPGTQTFWRVTVTVAGDWITTIGHSSFPAPPI